MIQWFQLLITLMLLQGLMHLNVVTGTYCIIIFSEKEENFNIYHQSAFLDISLTEGRPQGLNPIPPTQQATPVFLQSWCGTVLVLCLVSSTPQLLSYHTCPWPCECNEVCSINELSPHTCLTAKN